MHPCVTGFVYVPQNIELLEALCHPSRRFDDSAWAVYSSSPYASYTVGYIALGNCCRYDTIPVLIPRPGGAQSNAPSFRADVGGNLV